MHEDDLNPFNKEMTIGDATDQEGQSIGKGVFARNIIKAGFFVCEYYYKKSWTAKGNKAMTAEYNARPPCFQLLYYIQD